MLPIRLFLNANELNFSINTFDLGHKFFLANQDRHTRDLLAPFTREWRIRICLALSPARKSRHSQA